MNLYKYLILSIVTILPLCSWAENALNQGLSQSRFASYAEFAQHSCLPCHFNSENNSTNLIQPLERMNEKELQLYLSVMLAYGNMPPDPIFRDILIGKLNFMKQRPMPNQ